MLNEYVREHLTIFTKWPFLFKVMLITRSSTAVEMSQCCVSGDQSCRLKVCNRPMGF